MNVILLERIGRLGDLGDEVVVKSGFARNFLIPQGKAVRATDANRESFESRRAELEAAALKRRSAAEQRAAALDEQSVTIVARAAEEGKLYGSVGTAEIAQALSDKGIEVSKAEVRLPEGAIRQVGEYEVGVQIDTDMTVPIGVTIVAE
ncbi:MAG: 50S ribosomal protein L9 [Pseudomonadota bacterium]